MSKPSVIVGPRGDDWTVKRPGAERATRVVSTQREAAEIGRRIARHQQAELLIQGVDGRFRSKDSYGPDPNPPRDREH